MKQTTTKFFSKTNILIVGIVLIVVLFLLNQSIRPNIRKKTTTPPDTSQSIPPNVPHPIRTNLAFDKLPLGFRSDAPMEKDAKLTENYNAVFEDNNLWAVRTYETKTSLATLRDIYKKYLSTLPGWNVAPNHERDARNIFLSADRGRDSVIIYLRAAGAGINIVEITFISEQKK